jgi:hypothetical protein
MRDLRLYPDPRRDGELGGVPPELVHRLAVRVQHHGDQQAQFAIAQHRDSLD